MADFEIKLSDGKAYIYTPYNNDFVRRVKLLGGRWNASKRCWTIDERDVQDVRNAMREVYGRDDMPVTETVDVELTFVETVEERCAPVTIMGRTIASAFGRDSCAKIGDDVMFTAGAPESTGSAKNWYTTIPAGCVVKLVRLPKAMAESSVPDGVKVRILGEEVNRDELLAEKEKLLARIAEIDAMLEL